MPEPDKKMPEPEAASTSLERAAIVLLSMGEEPAAAVLRCLSREELLEVTQVMSHMSGIKVDSVRSSLQTFFDDYRDQSGVHGASRTYLKRSLDLALGPDVATSVLNNIYGEAIRPKMARLQWASAKWLVAQISNEHVQMQTVFLAFLPPALAGEVVGALPEARREQVLLNMARIRDVDRELLIELDELVDRCLESLGMQSTSIEGARQVAEILNRLPENRAQTVKSLRATDAVAMEEVERSMYDFFILSRQTEAVLLKLMEEVPVEEWAVALKGAEPALRDAILGSMPKRQAQAFEDTMKRTGPVPKSRIDQVRADIMKRVKTLADAGEIELQLFAEATVT